MYVMMKKSETVDPIKSERCKLAWKDYMIRHDCDFEIETDQGFKIDQNTDNCTEDLRRIVVTQTLVNDY